MSSGERHLHEADSYLLKYCTKRGTACAYHSAEINFKKSNTGSNKIQQNDTSTTNPTENTHLILQLYTAVSHLLTHITRAKMRGKKNSSTITQTGDKALLNRYK